MEPYIQMSCVIRSVNARQAYDKHLEMHEQDEAQIKDGPFILDNVLLNLESDHTDLQ